MPQKWRGAVVLQLRSFLTSALGRGNGQLDKPGLRIHEERDHNTDGRESLMGARARL